MLTKAETTALGKRIANLPIACRVQMFNEVIPWLRQNSPRYSVVDFYEVVFYYGDEESKRVRWNNLTARADLTDAP